MDILKKISKIDFLGISLPPRVGKSTLCIFFMTFVMGHRALFLLFILNTPSILLLKNGFYYIITAK